MQQHGASARVWRGSSTVPATGSCGSSTMLATESGSRERSSTYEGDGRKKPSILICCASEHFC